MRGYARSLNWRKAQALVERADACSPPTQQPLCVSRAQAGAAGADAAGGGAAAEIEHYRLDLPVASAGAGAQTAERLLHLLALLKLNLVQRKVGRQAGWLAGWQAGRGYGDA